MDNRFYLLKIKLLDIQPEIWRQFVVPADISLDRLHDVIQIIMGWQDYHLHQFTIGKKRYTEDPECKEDGLECGKYRLVDLIKRKGQTFSYHYDFGDSWEHKLKVEDSNYKIPPHLQEQFVFCMDGERACPPEDVGGFPGYINFSKIINNPSHKEYEEYLQWVGGAFDPEYFNPKEVNYILLSYLRWSRDRYLGWRND